jgi:hypothetical protein
VTWLDVLNADKLGDFWAVLREVDPRSIEREATRPIRIVVCGQADNGQRAIARELTTSASRDDVVDVYDMPVDVPIALPSADSYIYVLRSDRCDVAAAREHLWQLAKRGSGVLCVIRVPLESDGETFSPSEHLVAASRLDFPSAQIVVLGRDEIRGIERDLLPILLTQAPHVSLSLGRALPRARRAAANQLILETAKVNAEFAAVSSLPAIFPVVGGIAASGADLVVLTKNQAMLLVKLATIFERPTTNRWQLLSEILPVVGAAFMWRWAARALISLLPTPLSVAPRVGIAYVGTYVMGRAAAYYYEVGRRPPPDLLDTFAREAASQFDVLSPLLSNVRRRLPLI